MVRRDAARNRETLLTVAREAFTDADAEVSMAEIARRAGVGMATLYRNFPGRRELLEALYADEVDALCGAVATVGGTTPGDRFEAWVLRFFEYFNSKRHIADELLRHVGGDDPLFGGHRRRVLTAGAPLLAAAQAAGEVRADLDLDQMLAMVAAIAKLPGDDAYVQPILRAALDGLRLRPHGADS